MTDNTQPEALRLADDIHRWNNPCAKAAAQEFLDGVASLSAPLQSALDVIERWARDAYVVCGKPSTQEGFEAAWKAEDADAYEVWFAGRAYLSANAVEPVAQWQKRHPDDEDGRWQNTDAGDAEYWASRPGWQIRELYAAPLTAQAEGLTWTVFNSGAQVVEVESLAEAMEYLTPARLARQWCAVCVVDQSNLPPTSAEGVEHG